MRRIDRMRNSARRRFRRPAADEVTPARQRGTLLVDIRPQVQRTRSSDAVASPIH
jgi:hypothetical protein